MQDQRATHESQAMSRLLSCRRAQEADVPFLFDLRLASMDPHIVAAGLVLTAEQHMERVRDRLDSAEIILVEGAPVGMIKVTREDGFWHIMQFQVSPAMHGQGVGGEILQRVIAEACAAGAQLTLDVLKVNPVMRLYERLGFVVASESKLEFDMVWRGSDDELLAELSSLERELHVACIASNVSRVSEIIHADFKEFGRSGKTWNKAMLLQALDGSPSPDFHSQDFAIHSRKADSCLLTYRSADVAPGGELERHALRSSLWTRMNGRWQMIFHQGTATEAFARKPPG